MAIVSFSMDTFINELLASSLPYRKMLGKKMLSPTRCLKIINTCYDLEVKCNESQSETCLELRVDLYILRFPR